MSSEESIVLKGKTTGGEWIGILVVFIVIALLIVVVYIFYVPDLFQGSTVEPPQPPGQGAAVCPTSDAPTNLAGIQTDFSQGTADLTWDPVLTTNTQNEVVLGYNVYLSTNPGITEQNKVLRDFTPVPATKLTGLQEGTEYYFKIATVDSCGTGALSTDEATFTTAQ